MRQGFSTLGRVARFVRDTRAAATVEFILVFPIFIMTVLTVFEAGWFMTKSMMLDRGVEMAMRDLRLGAMTDPSADDVKAIICDRSIIFDGCSTSLQIELVPIANSSDFPSDDADCVDRTIEDLTLRPKDDFNPGARSEVMFVRACMVIDPIFPGIGLGLQLPKDTSGGVQMITYSAFVNEPE